MLKVSLFFRKREYGFFSIEEVFKNVIQQMDQIDLTTHYAPNKRITVIGLIKNLFWARKNNNQVNHITGDINYIALALSKNTILTFHDIGSLGAGRSVATRLKQLIWIKWPAARVKAITVISEFSRAEIIKIIPRQKHKIKVIHNPLSQAWYERKCDHKSFNSIATSILLVGTKTNKNLLRSIKACDTLNVELHILGKTNEDQIDLLNETGVTYHSYTELSSDELLDFYLKGDILCFPSTYEGFGLPIIEAQTLGIPVLTSNLGAMKEVAGDGACLVNPFDVGEIRSGIQKIINENEFRNDLIRKGKSNIKRFHPEKIAKEYIRLYNQMST